MYYSISKDNNTIDNLNLPVDGVLSNSGFFTTEFQRNTDKNHIQQGVNPHNRVLEKWGIDTVRLKFYFATDKQLENYVSCLYKEIKSFNIVKLKEEYTYIYYNIFGQKFLYNPSDRSAFLEFSLPKFLYYQNTAYCNEFDLFKYCNNYLSPYCHNGYILLNRIDFALQYSFKSQEELQGFDKFLRSCDIRRKQSSQDYCFWKFEERVIRFYDKKKDIERPGNKSHPSMGVIYDEWLKSLRWAEDNNIGRLEYQLRLGYIKNICKDRNIYKIDYDKLRNAVSEMLDKDFPLKEFTFTSKKPFYDCLQLIKGAFQRPDSYLEFINLAQKFGMSEARKMISQQMYSKMKLKLKERLNLTFEQILKAGECITAFPEVSMWEEKPERVNQFADFENLLLKNAQALLEDGYQEDEILSNLVDEVLIC